MICPNCGNENPNGSAFCVFCGAVVPASPVAQAPAAQAPTPDTNPGDGPSEPAPMPAFTPVPPAAPTGYGSPASAPQPAYGPRPEYKYCTAPGPIPGPMPGPVPGMPQGAYPYPGYGPAARKPAKVYDHTPISSWGYVGLNILFAIPVIGLIFIIVMACGGTRNINRRNYARSFLLGFLVTIIAILIFLVLYFVFGPWGITYYINI